MEHLGCLQTQRVRACRGVRSKPPLYRRGRSGQDMSCSRHTARRSPGAGRDQASPGLVPPIALEAFGASPTSALSVSSPSVWSPHCAPVPLLPELHPFPRALLRTGPTPAVTAPSSRVQKPSQEEQWVTLYRHAHSAQRCGRGQVGRVATRAEEHWSWAGGWLTAPAATGRGSATWHRPQTFWEPQSPHL